MTTTAEVKKRYKVPPPPSQEVQGIEDETEKILLDEIKDHPWNYKITIVDDVAVKACMTNAVVNDLYRCLIKVKNHFYDKQAHTLIHNNNNNNSSNKTAKLTFDIKISDLNEEIKNELDYIRKDKDKIDYILKEAVGRIFENVSRNYSYFFLSIKQFLNVRLIA